jgi:HlyD family secretion protein
MRRKSFVLFGVILLVLAAGAAGYYGLWLPRTQGTSAAQPQSSPIQYQTVQVQKGNFTGTIETTGTVRSNQTTTLVWQTSGTVQAVNVSKGQLVPAKTVLATLEQTSIPTAIIMAQADLVTAQKALDNLLTSTQARANAELVLVKAQKALDDANKARRNKEYQVASPENIDIANANLIIANDALNKANTIYEKNRDRDTNDVIYAAALSQYARAKQNQIKAQYNYDYVSGLPNALDIQEAIANVDVAEANLLQAKTDWERVKDGPNEQDVAAAQARVAAAQAAINLGRIAAPFQGTITQAISKVGDQVAPSAVAFQIDDLSHLFVDVAVAEVDIARIQIGPAVSLNLDALAGKTYPGKVTDIASVGKNTANTVNFTVTVEITQLDENIRPGMTVSGTIVTSQIQDALYVPTSAIRALNGKQLIYLLKDGLPTPVEVLPGNQVDGGNTLILKGALKAGDLVVANSDIIP